MPIYVFERGWGKVVDHEEIKGHRQRLGRGEGSRIKTWEARAKTYQDGAQHLLDAGVLREGGHGTERQKQAGHVGRVGWWGGPQVNKRGWLEARCRGGGGGRTEAKAGQKRAC